MNLFGSKKEKRIERWQSELIKRLAKEVRGSDDDKIKWLVQHLKEYMERWLGFANMPNVSVDATLNSDLFGVVMAAVDIVESLTTSRKAKIIFPKNEWSQFSNTLKWIQKEPARSELE